MNLALLLASCTEPKTAPATTRPTDTDPGDTDTTELPPPDDTAPDTSPTIVPVLPCGTLLSARSFGGDGDDAPPLIASAADGSLWMVASTSSPLTLGEGSPNETTITPAGTQDLWLAVEDPSGALRWARTIRSDDAIAAYTITPASDGGAVVSGLTTGAITVSQGQPDAASHPHQGQMDAWIARFGAQGELLWSHAFGTPGDEFATHAIFSDDSVGMALVRQGDLTLGEGEPNETFVPMDPGALRSTVLARFAPDGTLAWVQPWSGSNAAYNTVVDPVTGDLVVSGGAGTASLGQDAYGTVLASPSGSDAFVVRYAPDGTISQLFPTWLFGKVALDGSGDTLIAGTFLDTVTLDPGGPSQTTLDLRDSFNETGLAAFGPDGALRWATQTHTDAFNVFFDVAGASDGGSVLAGSFGFSLRLGEPGASATLLSTGDVDGYIARYSSSGDLLCAAQAGSSGLVNAFGTAQQPDGTWVVSGDFSGTMTLGAGTPQEVLLDSGDPDAGDIFIAVYAL